MTEGFSGADLQALLSDAQLEAVHDILNGENGEQSGKMPVITDTLLKRIASVAKPSVSENEKRRLYDIYSQFLDSKRSVASQVFSLLIIRHKIIQLWIRITNSRPPLLMLLYLFAFCSLETQKARERPSLEDQLQVYTYSKWIWEAKFPVQQVWMYQLVTFIKLFFLRYQQFFCLINIITRYLS